MPIKRNEKKSNFEFSEKILNDHLSPMKRTAKGMGIFRFNQAHIHVVHSREMALTRSPHTHTGLQPKQTQHENNLIVLAE